MRQSLVVFFLVCSFGVTTPAKSQIAVVDAKSIALQYLEYARQFFEVQHAFETLVSINGLSDLLYFLNHDALAVIRQHAPEDFQNLMESIRQVHGGARAVERVYRALNNWDSKSSYSKKESIDRFHKYIAENVERSKGYAGADYEAAGKTIERINMASGEAHGLESQKQRDQALIQMTAEAARGQQQALQSLSTLTDTISDENAVYLLEQQIHSTAFDEPGALFGGN